MVGAPARATSRVRAQRDHLRRDERGVSVGALLSARRRGPWTLLPLQPPPWATSCLRAASTGRCRNAGTHLHSRTYAYTRRAQRTLVVA